VDAAHALLTAGADRGAASREGLTALEAARREGHEDVVRLLEGTFTKVGEVGSRDALSFAHGVALEGRVLVKGESGLFRWKARYVVLSKGERALYYWSGDSSGVESGGGGVHRVAFNDIAGAEVRKGKRTGKRFDILLREGKPLACLVESPEEAAYWVQAVRRAVVESRDEAARAALYEAMMHTGEGVDDTTDIRERQGGMGMGRGRGEPVDPTMTSDSAGDVGKGDKVGHEAAAAMAHALSAAESDRTRLQK